MVHSTDNLVFNGLWVAQSAGYRKDVGHTEESFFQLHIESL